MIHWQTTYDSVVLMDDTSHTRFVDEILYDSVVLTKDTGLKLGCRMMMNNEKQRKKTEQAELTNSKSSDPSFAALRPRQRIVDTATCEPLY